MMGIHRWWIIVVCAAFVGWVVYVSVRGTKCLFWASCLISFKICRFFNRSSFVWAHTRLRPTALLDLNLNWISLFRDRLGGRDYLLVFVNSLIKVFWGLPVVVWLILLLLNVRVVNVFVCNYCELLAFLLWGLLARLLLAHDIRIFLRSFCLWIWLLLSLTVKARLDHCHYIFLFFFTVVSDRLRVSLIALNEILRMHRFLMRSTFNRLSCFKCKKFIVCPAVLSLWRTSL